MKPPKEYAKELSIEMCSVTDVVKPNFASNKKAVIAVDKILQILNTLAKPEYVAFLTNDLFKIDGQEYDTHAHGYDLQNYFEQVKTEINNLK